MNKTDKAIKEKMQIEYKNITPDMDKLIMATEQEHKSVKRQKSGWKKYVAAAAIFAIIISMAGSSTIRAFLLDIYERYFIKTQQIFEENTEAYIRIWIWNMILKVKKLSSNNMW